MASPDPPATFLKHGHSLKGKDILPVVMRIRQCVDDRPEEADLASVSRKYSLASYSAPELKTEFSKLTGYQLEEVLQVAGLQPTRQECLLALHCAVLQANAAGAPEGSSLASPDEHRSHKSKLPPKKRVCEILFPLFVCLFCFLLL